MGTMCNEVVVALRYCSSIFQKQIRKTMKIHGMDTRCHGLDSKLTSPEYTSRVLPLHQSARFLKMERGETIRNKKESCIAYNVQNSASSNVPISLSSDL